MKVTCPYCGKVNDQHTNFERSAPRDGDIAMCIGCGECAIFDLAEKRLRLPNVAEQFEIDSNERVRLFRFAWRQTVKKQRH